MTKGEVTQLHLINVGASLFHLQGYKHTSLSQILNAAKVTKGSFYFHFEDKQAFGLAVLNQQIDWFKESSRLHLNNSDLSPLEKIETFYRSNVVFFQKNDFKYGCLLGNFSQEMSTLSTEFAHKIAMAFDEMVALVSDVICEGILMGEFNAIEDIDLFANFFINSWEGALVRMKSVKDESSLVNWFTMIKQLLFIT